MDILRIYQDYNIPYQTEGHKHCRPGWANTACPFCTGNPGLHLGASLDGGHFYCWRCGWHPAKQSLSKLLGISEKEANKIISQYGGKSIAAPEAKIQIRAKAFKYPAMTGDLGKAHRAYLEKRKFDPDLIAWQWGVKGIGPMGFLDGVNYGRRILIPIEWDGSPVTFQARDITDRHPMKYLACMKEREIIHHKEILYGKQEFWGETGICVEGVMDVWRFGMKAFATFGIEYTPKQLRIMARSFKRIAVIFDDEIQAQIQAKKLVADLCFRGVDAFPVIIEGDPGEMDQDEANYLINSLFKK
jgi:DNA primase